MSGVLGTVAGSGSPVGGVLGTVTGSALSPVTTSDTLVWSPSGAACGRPIDQWSMGGISVPAGTAGLLAPCVSDDQLAQAGSWAISYTSAPLAHAETIAGPVTATVYASSTTAQSEFVAELEDVTPSGASYPLTEGALLGSLRAVDKKRSWTEGGITALPYHPYAQASAKPVTPGTVTEYQIQIFTTLATIAAGNQLRLTLADQRYPAPGAAARAASPAGWRCLHDRALSDRSVVAHGRDAQVASSEPGSAGTSTAYCSSRSSGTRSSARSWVAARTTKAATPSSCARSHAWVVTHQRSPG